MNSDSGSELEGTASAMRRSTRTTAGVPPTRWGEDTPPSKGQAMAKSTVIPPEAQDQGEPPSSSPRVVSSRASIASSVASVDRRRREVEFENRKQLLEMEAEERKIEAEQRQIEAERRRADLRAQIELQKMQRDKDLADLEEEERQSYLAWDGGSSEEEDPRSRHGDGHTQVRTDSWVNQSAPPDPTGVQTSAPPSPNPANRAPQTNHQPQASQQPAPEQVWSRPPQQQIWEVPERFPAVYPRTQPPINQHAVQKPPEQRYWPAPPETRTGQPAFLTQAWQPPMQPRTWQPPRVSRPHPERDPFEFEVEKRSPPDPPEGEQRAHSVPPERPAPERDPTLVDLLKTMVEAQTRPSGHARDLPPFSGQAQEWPVFIAEYRQTTAAYRVSNMDNRNRLQRALKGKALEAVRALLVHPDNVDRAIEHLEMRFGQPTEIIESIIHEMGQVKKLKEDDPTQVVELSSAVLNLVTIVESLGKPEYLQNTYLLVGLEDKLTTLLRVSWTRKKLSLPYAGSIADFAEWLKEEARVYAHMHKSGPAVNRPSEPKFRNDRRPAQKVFTASESPETGPEPETQPEKTPRPKSQNPNGCGFCGKPGHRVDECRSFGRLAVKDRKKWAREQNACYKCLQGGHRIVKCPKEAVCGKDGCSSAHHRLLHENPTQDKKQNEPVVQVETSAHVTGPTRKGSNRVLLKVLPVTLTGPNGSVSTYALLDEGSTVTLVAEEVAKQLGATGPEQKLNLAWINATGKEMPSRRVNLTVQGTREKTPYQLLSARTVQNLKLPAQTTRMPDLEAHWKHLEGFDVTSLINAVPTILIGADNAHLIVSLEIHQGPKNSPIISRTKLGYAVHGPTTEFTGRKESEVSFFTWTREKEDDIHQMVKDYFSTETFGVKVPVNKVQSKEADRCEALLQSTSKRIGNKWETGLLWRNDDVKFPESRDYAVKRLQSIERKMDRDPEFAKEYSTKVEDNVKKGYARKLTKSEAEIRNQRTWYLAHFDHYQPNKPKKLRVVYDAAAEVRGVSLNKQLLKGPDLLSPLPSVLMRFRQYAVAFSGDIHEFFPQIRVREEDADCQRFLWRGMDRSKPPDEYRLEVLTFGAACSPASALYVKNRNAAEFRDKFPQAEKAIVENHYVDDYLDSAKTVHEAATRIREVVWVHEQGGFQVKGWTSSHPEALRGVPEGMRASPKNLDLTETTVERVLGHYWIPTADVFTFTGKLTRVKPEVLRGERRPTKREILSLLMTVFDPLGLLSHFTVKMKILLQDVWRSGIGWDDELPSTLNERWIEWTEELKRITEVSVPRCYSPLIPEASDIQLHVFVDASEQAFASVAYWRIKAGQEVHTTFITAKSRVSPLKPMSIPRLELQAAVLGSRLAETVKNYHDFPVHATHLWSDSRTVLCWLRSDARKFKPFVAHRVGEIEELGTNATWHWVPTKLNVADDATRSSGESDLSPGGRWFTGPSFLKASEEEWPKEKSRGAASDLKGLKDEDFEVYEQTLAELKGHEEFLGVVRPAPKGIAFRNFSTWKSLKRGVAWVKRCVAQYQIKKAGGLQKKEPKEVLEVSELEEAEIVILKMVQAECFPAEVELLKNGKTLPGSSKIFCLSPTIDKNGLIRMSGRTRRSHELAENCKSPVILDPKHYVTRLLVQDAHHRLNHTGQEAVHNELRQRYWIIHGRSAVRQISHQCPACRRATTKPMTQEMGELPPARVTRQTRPFVETGLDYFGPMEVTVGRRHEKRYGALFTCMATRAVHIEVADTLTTDSAIMAIQRFIGVRGCPKTIHSDNGTNFRGADNELKRAILELDQDRIQKNMADRGIEWRFIPPSAPHMGGAWERMVKSVKVALRATLKERAPKCEVLRTLLAEAAHSVNSRPLTHVSLDPDDPEALTPNHFLIGQSSGTPVFGQCGTEERDLKSQWRKSQALANMFWNRWVKEYLPTLNQRSKWLKKMDPPKVGDFVFIGDGTLPRNSWPKGIITAVHLGKDGRVRVVDVRTSTGTLTRPIAKIMMPGSQLVDVGTLSPTSGGGMSPCLKTPSGEKQETTGMIRGGTGQTPDKRDRNGQEKGSLCETKEQAAERARTTSAAEGEATAIAQVPKPSK